MKTLGSVLTKLDEAGIRSKIGNCKVLQQKNEELGYRVSQTEK